MYVGVLETKSKKFPKIIQSQKGFSIVEVLVVVGIMAIMAAGMATMSVNSIKSANKVGGNYNLSGLIQALHTYSYNEASCKNMLAGANNSMDYASLSSNSVVPFQLNVPGAGLVASGQALPNYDINVKSFELRNIQKLGSDSNQNKFVVGTLFLGAENAKQTIGGQGFKERSTISLNLKLNSAGQIIDCAGTSLTSANVGGNGNGAGGVPGGPGSPGYAGYPGAPGTPTNASDPNAGGGTGGTGGSGGTGGVGGTTPSPDAVLPNGQKVGDAVTPTCDPACVVQQYFVRNAPNSTPTQATDLANEWMATVGQTAYTTYANAYSMNQTVGTNGVANNAVATGAALGYNQAAVDSWTATTYNQYNTTTVAASNHGADLFANTVTGYNTAAGIYSQSVIQDYIATQGVEKANAAALIVTSATSSGMSATQVNSAIAAANSMYTPDQIASYFASGGSVASAIAAGLIPGP